MSAFLGSAPEFEAFLVGAKDDMNLAPGLGGVRHNTRFIAQNFLIEERLDPVRVESYGHVLRSIAVLDFEAWCEAHNRYLKRHVFPTPPAEHDYRVVRRASAVECPETFRAPVALHTFEGTDLDTAFVRIVPCADIAWMAREGEDYVYSLAEQSLADPRSSSPARAELSRVLEAAFTGPLCQHRPVFASFYEDCQDALTEADWANRLRDRLGLYHINQWAPGRLPRRVLLFKYKVREIPRHEGRDEVHRRPIAVPVALDHRLFEAFCPAPQELDRGRLLNLQTDSLLEPAREVLHLFMPLQVDHLVRVGEVTSPVREDLAQLRSEHLLWLGLLSGRERFGQV